MVTFAIVGHNEEDSVGRVVSQALAAARPGDRVLVVDSASTDATADRAREAGAEVLPGPLGKGAAIAVAVAATRTDWICFLDADLRQSQRNIPAVLRTAVGDDVDHILGDFQIDRTVIQGRMLGVYRPLVGALFPEVAGRLGSKPLTGFRAVRTKYVQEGLPPDFGVEAHINIEVAMHGGRPLVVDVGRFAGKIRPNPTMGAEIMRAVLDRAERYGRLDRALRPAWEAWVADVGASIAGGYRLDDPQDAARFEREVLATAARPLPPAHTTHG